MKWFSYSKRRSSKNSDYLLRNTRITRFCFIYMSQKRKSAIESDISRVEGASPFDVTTFPTNPILSERALKSVRVQVAMVSDADGDRLLHIAVAEENTIFVHRLCEIMLKAAISLDLTNFLRQTPLHLSVMLGNADITQLLMQSGASATLCDRNGSSILHLAVKMSVSENVMQIVLSSPQTRDIMDLRDYEGYGALHYAVLKDNKMAVTNLCHKGAAIDIRDGKSGRTPLILAVLNENDGMVELLLQNGACPDANDYSGRTPFDYANLSSCRHILRLLHWKIPHLSEQSTTENETNMKSIKGKTIVKRTFFRRTRRKNEK